MTIRTYQESDRSTVVALWNAVFPKPEPHNDPNASIERKMASDDGLFFVAEIDETVVGTVMAGYDGHRGWIYSLAVETRFRRQGIGSALLQQAEEELRRRGCPKINLQVIAGNDEAVEFYRRLGFVQEPRVDFGKRLVT